MSKRELKRQKKWEQYQNLRPQLRKLEREAAKLKRKQRIEEEKRKLQEAGHSAGEIIKSLARPKFKLMSQSSNKFKVIIDLDFEDVLTDHEISKSVMQLNRIYHANRYSENPCQLYFTSMKGKMRQACESKNTGYNNWDVNISEEDYLETIQKTHGQDRDKIKENIIYLSGDSDETLPEVEQLLKDESKIFVIGGLVDHNRLKNLCKDRARDRNISTARLPIKENVSLTQRSILSTLAVFEVLVNALGSHKPWKEALLASIPKRKLCQDDSAKT